MYNLLDVIKINLSFPDTNIYKYNQTNKSLINFFNKVYEDLSEKNFNKDEDLIRYFKSEYGKEWKIELDKHLIKTEFDINKKAA